MFGPVTFSYTADRQESARPRNRSPAEPGSAPAIMATAVVASLPAAFILVLAQRYAAAGVTAGAVKD